MPTTDLDNPTTDFPLTDVYQSLTGTLPESVTQLLAQPRISGTYEGQLAQPSALQPGLILEIRLDVDRKRPLRIASGDFFSSQRTYLHSFVMAELKVVDVTSSTIRFEGIPQFSEADARVMSDLGALPASIHIDVQMQAQPIVLLTLRSDSAAESGIFRCEFRRSSFRVLRYEIDHVAGIQPLAEYRMTQDQLLNGNRYRRDLTVSSALSEAGIQVIEDQGSAEITGDYDPTGEWTDSELLDAMSANSRIDQAEPASRWGVWVLAATHSNKRTSDNKHYVWGVMFDRTDSAQRQGCAIFHHTLGEKAAATHVPPDRLALFTYVHEIGHCLNLTHAFEAGPNTDPLSPVLSWMNYPENYGKGGEPLRDARFFLDFPFRFDALTRKELQHLRHGALNTVMPGASPFAGSGSALHSVDAKALVDRISLSTPNDADFSLELRTARPSFGFGEPVLVELKVTRNARSEAPFNQHLHPRFGFVKMFIEKPNGALAVYQPLFEYCISEGCRKMDQRDAAIYESAYIGYGADGFYFDQIGFYTIRATYAAANGATGISKPLRVRVRQPLNAEDEAVADLMFGEEQGVLLYLLGSDSDVLKTGNDAFAELLGKYTHHPLTNYARLAQGVNANRNFKQFTEKRRLKTRGEDVEASIKLLRPVIDASIEGRGLDNISLNFAFRCLATAQIRLGDLDAADETLHSMSSYFASKHLKPGILSTIEQQKQEARQSGAPLTY